MKTKVLMSSLLTIAIGGVLSSVSSGAAIFSTALPVTTTNTDFSRTPVSAGITSLPVSASQAGGSYTVTTATVNAVATVSSGSVATPSFSLDLTNNTGSPIIGFSFAGTVYQFKDNSSNVIETLTATGSGLTGATPGDLSFTSIANDGGSTSSVNNPPLTAAYTRTLSGFSLANGSTATITFTDANDAGTDAMFGLGNLVITPVFAPVISPEPMSIAAFMAASLFARRRK